MSYSVRSAPADDTSGPAPMQTIPESSSPSTQATDSPPTMKRSAGQVTLQYQEHLVDTDSARRPPKRSPVKHVTSSTSMDSLLSLSDVDFGMEEQTRSSEEPVMEEKKFRVSRLGTYRQSARCVGL